MRELLGPASLIALFGKDNGENGQPSSQKRDRRVAQFGKDKTGLPQSVQQRDHMV